jgi:hypothetical protein
MPQIRNERGQTSAEHLGVVVAIAFLIGSLVVAAPGIGGSIRSSIEAVVCRIAGDGCGSGEDGTAGGAPISGIGGDVGAGVDADLEGEAAAGAEDDGGGNWFTNAVGDVGSALGDAASGAADFGRGALTGTGDLVGGLWATGVGAVGFTYRSTAAYFFDREAFDRQWRDTGDFASYVWNNPGEFGKNVLDAFTEPFTSRFEGGLTAEEAGELAPEILATLVPIGKLGKLGRLGRVGDNADDLRDLGRLRGQSDELAELSARYGDDIVDIRTLERADLPPLANPSFINAFTDGVYEAVILPAGSVVYRVENAGARGPGGWLGLTKPTTRQEGEALYNVRRFGNNLDVVRTYEVTEDVAVYVGRVAGGDGWQFLIPDNVSPSDVLRRTGEDPLE